MVSRSASCSGDQSKSSYCRSQLSVTFIGAGTVNRLGEAVNVRAGFSHEKAQEFTKSFVPCRAFVWPTCGFEPGSLESQNELDFLKCRDQSFAPMIAKALPGKNPTLRLSLRLFAVGAALSLT